jgi:hypothetical protein
MNSPIAFLEYTFLIDTDKAFSHLYEFEKVFTEFLATRSLEATNIKSVEGSLAKRVMFITRKEQVVGMPEQKPVNRPRTIKSQIRQLADRKFTKTQINFMKGK